MAEWFLKIKDVVMNLELRECLIIFGILLVGTLFLGSRISGWHKLERHYATGDRYQGKWISHPDMYGGEAGDVEVYLNGHLSNGAIKMGADIHGLYLSMSLGFRLFHRPLFIPWREVNGVWMRGVPWSKEKNLLRLTFAAQPDVRLDIDRHIAEEMHQRSKGRWIIPEVIGVKR